MVLSSDGGTFKRWNLVEGRVCLGRGYWYLVLPPPFCSGHCKMKQVFFLHLCHSPCHQPESNEATQAWTEVSETMKQNKFFLLMSCYLRYFVTVTEI